MPLINVVIVLIIVGVLLWLVNSYIPMAEPVKKLLNAVVIIALVLWVITLFTGFNLAAIRIGHT